MKKQSFLLVVLIVVAFNCMAQNLNLSNKGINLFDKKEFSSHLKRLTVQKPGADYNNLPALRDNENWWEPDTIVYTKTDRKTREIRTYNELGYLIRKLLQYHQSSSDEWVDFKKYTYDRDEQNRVLIYSEQTRYNTWENTERKIYTYDENNNVLTELIQEGFIDEWKNSTQWIYTYDERNNMLTDTWGGFFYGEWTADIRQSYTYDEQDNLLTEARHFFVNNEWKDNYKCIYTYNEAYLPTSFLWLWLWNEENGWENYEQEFYTYDERGNLLTLSNQYWYNDAWRDDFKHIMTYNEKDYLATLTYQKGGSLLDQWQDQERSIYNYNNQNLISEIIDQWWSTVIWENVTRTSYTYDNQNNILSIFGQASNPSQWTADKTLISYTYNENNNCILVENQVYGNGEWFECDEYTPFYYNNMKSVSDFYAHKIEISYTKAAKPDGIEENNSEKITVYPNPFTTQITISASDDCKINSVTIFNLLGHQIENTTNTTLNMQDLPIGVYFLKINTNHGISIEKILKQ